MHIKERVSTGGLAAFSFLIMVASVQSGALRVHLSWGHQRTAEDRQVGIEAVQVEIAGIVPVDLESGDLLESGQFRGRAGGGDVDGLSLSLHFPDRAVSAIPRPHEIWSYLLDKGDKETAERLRRDPGFRPDERKLTIRTNAEGTRGFSLTVDQLLQNQAFWIPELDFYISTGEAPLSYRDHRQSLQSRAGRKILDRVQAEPEASYSPWTARWEDMGHPSYHNPHATGNGHIVCVGWDSSFYKFGIDRGAGVCNDFGNPDHFRFHFDFGDLTQDITNTWKGQTLIDGPPILKTVFEKDGVRYEVEQFAYPRRGAAINRNDNSPMVLMQKIRLTELEGRIRSLNIGLSLHREHVTGQSDTAIRTKDLIWTLEDSSEQILLCVEGANLSFVPDTIGPDKPGVVRTTIKARLEGKGQSEFVVKLPSPAVGAEHRETFLKLDYAVVRAATHKFWSDYLAAGAQFVVPDEAVNTLFRANLWHALRLPRRYSDSDGAVRIDLPYSNFAYDQKGIPWPINQAVYVDYMLYDLRGYHNLAAEELEAMFRGNQEPDGHIRGYANWGVYTPGMIYAVAQHYRLSGDRTSLDRLLPQALKAMVWCMGEVRQAAPGLVLAPLNDLSTENGAWAFNQAYLFAGLDAFSVVLKEIGHSAAPQCRAAADSLWRSIERAFGRASMQSPLVQLCDGTWIPYVPGDAWTPRRRPEIWYPSDVDTGPMHLPRLKALDPQADLTTFLLNDHEDNLFFNGWGMANEPVYNQQATVYLYRDQVKPTIRAFYSMMACAFSHSVFEPVEHRWGWGQYFGPPSTDGAWFELYRHMLLRECDDDSLLIFQAVPRAWFEDGKQIRIERAPSHFGPIAMRMDSRAASGTITAIVDRPARKRPSRLIVRFRHPKSLPIKAVTVNGSVWAGVDIPKEWIVIPDPKDKQYTIIASY
ncbi:MAG: hypothetical protein JW828_11680 [Sedimentisphaerales bacterium]|nr:hypothetical protein [Sedimentisphaerales bacterium]